MERMKKVTRTKEAQMLQRMPCNKPLNRMFFLKNTLENCPAHLLIYRHSALPPNDILTKKTQALSSPLVVAQSLIHGILEALI